MSKHTPGPWRWEVNPKHKRVQLVGGRPQFDLTVMDFDRWGMGGAAPRFRDTEEDGLNLMGRLPDRQGWLSPFPGREHHASWLLAATHPDARLIAAAPDLLRIVRTLRAALDTHGEHLLGCSYHAPSVTPCNCGLDAALDEGAEIIRRLG